MSGTGARAASQPRSDELTARLRDEILAGRHRAGERLPPERQLALQLGVGRSTVREALRKLEQLGLVSIRHGGGATVLPLEDASLGILPHLLVRDGRADAELVDQLLDVYEVVMQAAAGFALARASEAELERAGALLRDLQVDDLDDAAYFAAMEELVQLVSVASGNLVLRLVRNGLKSLFAPQLEAGEAPPERAPASVVGPVARDVERAIERRDVAAVQAGVVAMLREIRPRVHRRLEARAAGGGAARPRLVAVAPQESRP